MQTGKVGRMAASLSKYILARIDRSQRRRLMNYALPLLGGILLGALALVLPLEYFILALGGLVFAYLLIFKIEIAIILALFIQNQLARFNYMGQGTPFHPNGIMGVAIIAGAIFYFLFHKIDFSRLRGIEAFAAFLAISGVSLVNAGPYTMDGVGVLLRLLAAFAIFAVLCHKLDSIKMVKWVLAAVIAAQVIPTISGLIMYAGLTGFLFSDETMRLGNSGVGVYMSMITSLCLVFLLSRRSIQSWLVWAGLTILFALGLYFSFGRSGWLGFLVAVIAMSMIRFRRLIFIFPFLLFIVVMLIPGFSQRFSDINFSINQDGTNSTLDQRFEFWQAALTLSSDDPVVGVGFGVGKYAVAEYRGGYAYMIHNDYISVLLETGIIGLIFFIAWQCQWLVLLANTYRKATDDFQRTMSLAVLITFLASLVMRITDNLVLDSYDMYPLSALVGAALAMPHIRKSDSLQDLSVTEPDGQSIKDTNHA